MKTLVLDSAFTPVAIVLSDNKKLGEVVSKNEKNSETFMQDIDNCLSMAKLTIDDIDEIAINLGPGSFTGLRVGVSIAKGLGFASDMKYTAFTSFDYVSANKTILVPGFSSFVYIKFLDGNMNCVDIDSLDKKLKYVTMCDAIYNTLKTNGYDIEFQKKLPYEKIILKTQNKFLKINQLEPLYLRKSQAELMREAGVKGKK